jgi:hypothetical protein
MARKKGGLLESIFGLLVSRPRTKAKARRDATADFDLRVSKGARVAAERARSKAIRERERAHRLTDQANRARLRRVEVPSRAKAKTAEKRSENLDQLANRIEHGEYQPGELKALMESGTLRIKTL